MRATVRDKVRGTARGTQYLSRSVDAGGCLHRQPGPWDHYEPTEQDRRAWVVSGDEFADASPTGWDNNSTEELDDEEVLH